MKHEFPGRARPGKSAALTGRSMLQRSSLSGWGRSEDQELQQRLADPGRASRRRDTGRFFSPVGTGMATGIAAAGEGRVVARERGGRRGALLRRAGAALPPSFAD